MNTLNEAGIYPSDFISSSAYLSVEKLLNDAKEKNAKLTQDLEDRPDVVFVLSTPEDLRKSMLELGINGNGVVTKFQEIVEIRKVLREVEDYLNKHGDPVGEKRNQLLSKINNILQP